MFALKTSLTEAIFSNPIKTSLRFRYHAEKVSASPVRRRYGYEERIFQKGLLPREIYPDKPLPTPDYKPHNSWNAKRALFGQNDYIDILGPFTESQRKPILPTQLLYNVPNWLRGVSGNEYQVLLRKRKFLKHKGYHLGHPTKWDALNVQIKKLNKFLNRKTRSPLWKDS
nr:EOG090X0JAK [Macrothrix elegans]